MDISALSGLFSTFGIGGVFLYASWYLMKRLEAREAQQREEALARENRLIVALKESETYTRTTVVTVVEKNTAAMNSMANAFEGLACRELRREDLKPVIDNARRRAGEGG